jgi:hypothetical protein
MLLLLAAAALRLLATELCLAEESKIPDLYRTAASILALPPEQAKLEHPALVHGVVTQSTDHGLVVQDSTAGIWIYWESSGDFVPGDDVEVEGVAGTGRYAPVVKAFSVRKLGRAPLPIPKEATYKQLSAGDEECQYVSVTGTVRSVGVRSGASPKQK